jgi:hypothetical protein
MRKKKKDGDWIEEEREIGREGGKAAIQKGQFRQHDIELVFSNFALIVGHFPTLFLLTEAQTNDAFLSCGGHKRTVLSKDAAKA